jgi:hypothetical protein
MRATGFGFKSPKEHSGEYLYPMMKNNGNSLILNQRKISDIKREGLFLHKSGLLNHSEPKQVVKKEM